MGHSIIVLARCSRTLPQPASKAGMTVRRVGDEPVLDRGMGNATAAPHWRSGSVCVAAIPSIDAAAHSRLEVLTFLF